MPDSCLVIFHQGLFHYGDRNEFSNYKFQKTFRFFAYLREVRYVIDVKEPTYPALPHLWCNDDCEPCKKIRSTIIDVRCDCEANCRWICPKSIHHINIMNDGAHIMGNLDTLGWAVIKGASVHDQDKVNHANMMNGLGSHLR